MDTRPLKISAVGDISLGDHPVCIGHGMRTAFSKLGSRILKDVAPYLMDSDAVIGNLETVASDVGLVPRSLASYEMRGNPEHLEYLREAGFDVIGVANNHAMQHGKRAFWDTVANVKKVGIDVIGLDSEGRTNVHEIVHDGAKHFIFNVSLRPEEWADDKDDLPYSYRDSQSKLLSEVKALRSECPGFLICSIHWGLEFLDYPSSEQVQLGRALVDAGVDVVFGHHAHVIQPVERYKQGLIFYSLGNFVFDLWPSNTKKTLIAQVELEVGKDPSFKWIPVEIDRRFGLSIATEQSSKVIDSLLSWERYESMANRPVTDTDYVARYRVEEKKFRYSSYRYFLKNLYRYPPHFLLQSLARTAFRRLTGT